MGSGVNNTVRVLLASEDLYVGGEFTLAGGKSSAYMGRWAVNEPPIDITLSSNHIDENRPSGTTVGTLSASDPNAGDSHTFSLVSTAPCPGPDNTAFTINASQLRTAQVFNYEVKNSYAICVRATDSQGGTYEKAFTVTVDNVNEAPITVNDAYTTDEDVPLTVPAPGVLGNDSDPEDDLLTAAVQTQPAHGSVVVNTNGSFTYSPVIGYNGSDSFTYLARDGSLNTTGTVDITINPVNSNVSAVNDSYTTAEDSPLDVPAPGVLGNDSDPDSDPLHATLDTPPTHGNLDLNNDGSFNYVPFENYTGTDYFIYAASDGTFSDRATVTITVTPINDPPNANNNSYTTAEDHAITRGAPGVLGNDSDVDGDDLIAALNDPPAHGTVDLNPNGSFTYTPAANYYGSDSFTYTASDGSLTEDATVNLTINASPDPPQAHNNSYTTPEDTPLNVAQPGVLGNDSDPDGDPLTAAIKTPPTHGTLTLNANGSFTYTPAPGYYGSDSFKYTASDGDLTDDATVNLTVSPGNDPPQASDDSYVVNKNTPKTVPAPGVLGNDSDIDGDHLTAQVQSQPSHGSLTLNANGSFTYTPATGYTGSDSFTYRASDGHLSDTATVTLNVNADNHRPQAVDNSYTAIQDTPLEVSAPGVLGNDSDTDGDHLSASLKNAPTHGTLELHANGSFTYTPQAGYIGPDTFTYTASDGDMSDTAAVTITVLISPEEGYWIYMPVAVGSYPN
jgi:VCBS repeat-containing protein